MKYMRQNIINYRVLYIVSIVISASILLFPGVADAQGGLVVCDGTGDNPCDFCALGVMANNVINWLFGFMTLVAVLTFAYAGFQMVTSGGDTGARDAAKKRFMYVIIGFLLMLSSWLIIDTLLKGLTGSEKGMEYWGSFDIDNCGSMNKPENRVDGYKTYTAEFDPYYFNAKSQHYDTEGYVGTSNVADGFGSGSAIACQAPTSGPCSVAALKAAGFGNLAEDAARIVGAESRCIASAESRTDTTTDGRTYSAGVWQINMAVHKIKCNNQILDCPAAFKKTNSRNSFGVRQYEIVNESLYQACLTSAKNATCNNAAAARLATNSKDMGDWACSARKCGISTTRNHLCPL